MQPSKQLRMAVVIAMAGSAFMGSRPAAAAGFSLAEQNASGLGNAYAGVAASAEDASTVYFNAAGMTQLKRPSLVSSVTGININSKFTNSGSVAALGQALGSSGGNAGGFTALPALYIVVPLNDRVSGGLGVNVPFGLKTEYDADYLGRFQAIKSEVKTTNINTSLAFKLGSRVSLGIGLDYQTLDATLTKGVNYTAIIASNTGGAVVLPGLQGVTQVRGSDAAYGFDVGLLFNLTDQTRLGLSYRSAIKYNVDGNATFTAPATSNPTGQAVINGARATSLADGPVTLGIKLPASARLAMTQKLGSQFELLGEVQWTQWSSIPELRVKRPNGTTLTNTVENWENSLRYALGANYQVNDALKLRVGVALDETPVPDTTRTPRLPDEDRKWLSAGAKFKVGNNAAVDVGYTHIFVNGATLNQNDGSTAAFGLINGSGKVDIDILGVQATVSF